MRTILVFLLMSTILFSCKKTESKTSQNQCNETSSINKTDIKIILDEETLTSYQIISTFIDKNDAESIFAYNSFTHTIDGFDINNKSIMHVRLEAEGENGVLKNVSGMHVHNLDSIWLYSQGVLYLCNNRGEVEKNTKLPYPNNGFIMIDTNFSTTTSKLYYNKIRHSIFYLTVNKTDENTNYIAYEYNPDTGNYKTFLIEGNDIEKKAGTHYGWKQFPNITYSESYINYNFPITSSVYRIDIKNNTRIFSEGKNKFTSNLVSELSMPYNFEQADKHLLENVHFFELEYDSKKNIYYRIHVNKIESKGRSRSREQYNSKEIFLTIFDCDFNIINEVQLESNTYNLLNCWGILSTGFFITKDNYNDIQKNPEVMEISILNVQKV